MKHGSLFSGIGGFDLAAEWMGWENVFHCEWMEFPRKVLDYYWPNADSHIDICKTDFKKYANKIDILTGGWPSGGFPVVSRSAMREKEKGQKTNAFYGMRCLEQYKKLNRNLSSEKMYLVSQILTADWFSKRCALTWKLKGTKYNRLLFQLVPKMHRTDEIDVGLLELGMLPTPTAMDSSNATATMKSTQVKEGSMHSVTLVRAMAMGMLPTPTSGSQNSQHSIAEWGGSGNNMRKIPGSFSPLNPRFVAEMMGFPPNWTELPFLNGEQNQLRVTETP
jgi:hypothetical protein